MARTRTTKTVAQRIDLNYFKRATPFKRAKLWLAILAPAAAVVWTGWHFFGGDQRVYSSGRLSEAHAVLEKQCVACHVQQAGRFSAKAKDAACLGCHDGPQHHPFDKEMNCSDCHLEHRGRNAVSSVATAGCALCHSRLSRPTWGHIVDFGNSHPEFAGLRGASGGPGKDPGTIRLNHALHMKAIRRAPNGPLVQLECSDCHRPSATNDLDWKYGDKNYAAAMVTYTAVESFEPGGTRGLPTKHPWSDRQLMAPVKFANACAGCHLLTFDKRFDEGVPHDRPDVVHDFLVKKFSAYISAHPGELREAWDPERNLTDRAEGPGARVVPAGQWVAEHVAVAEELLWHKTCAQCHAITATPLQDVKIARWDAESPVPARAPRGDASDGNEKLPRIAAARTTLQWLPHAKFDHDAHTGFSCTGCHPNALKSTESSDLLIPGIAVCQKCHADGPGYTSAKCSECHTYHDWSKRKEVNPTFTLPAQLRGGQ